MTEKLARVRLTLDVARGAVLAVVGTRLAVGALRQLLAADKAATVAHLEHQAAAEAETNGDGPLAPEEQPPPEPPAA